MRSLAFNYTRFVSTACTWLAQVQILSHQSKIATQIELFVGHGHTYRSAQFRRLGYLSLNKNERSDYQARELKSVYVDATGQYLRILLHKCYINELNLFNQVGGGIGAISSPTPLLYVNQVKEERHLASCLIALMFWLLDEDTGVIFTVVSL